MAAKQNYVEPELICHGSIANQTLTGRGYDWGDFVKKFFKKNKDRDYHDRDDCGSRKFKHFG